MTQAKAKKLMLEYARDVVQPSFASKITQAFGFSLSDLGIKPQKVSEFAIISADETKSLLAVSMSDVARALAQEVAGIIVSSNLHGRGSSAQDIVKKAVALL